MDTWRKRYDDLEKNLSNLVQIQVESDNYKDRIEDLEMKIKILIEENEKLNSCLNENMKF